MELDDLVKGVRGGKDGGCGLGSVRKEKKNSSVQNRGIFFSGDAREGDGRLRTLV